MGGEEHERELGADQSARALTRVFKGVPPGGRAARASSNPKNRSCRCCSFSVARCFSRWLSAGQKKFRPLSISSRRSQPQKNASAKRVSLEPCGPEPPSPAPALRPRLAWSSPDSAAAAKSSSLSAAEYQGLGPGPDTAASTVTELVRVRWLP